MRPSFRFLSMLGLMLGVACSDAGILEPSNESASLANHAGRAASGAQRVAVMTQNLYVGADVDAIIAALKSPDPTDDLPALLAAIETVQKTDFPSRAAAIANEIDRARPLFVGLQEVSQIAIQLPGINLSLDFLSVLQTEITSRGLNYAVAVQVQNVAAAPLPGVSLLDFDAMLVDADRVTVNATLAANFTNNVGPVAPGVQLIRGWVAVKATVGDQTYTVASTHLESGNFPGFAQLRAAQIGELIAILGTDSPAIVLGDLNDLPGSLMYQTIAGAGFTDVWGALRAGAAGFSCCHAADLSNQVGELNQRIDYVFVRGLGHGQKEVLGQVTLVGAQPEDRVPGPFYKIWPSDHAGLVANFLLPPAHGLADLAAATPRWR